MKTQYIRTCKTAKEIFKGKFIDLHKYIRKEEMSKKMSNL